MAPYILVFAWVLLVSVAARSGCGQVALAHKVPSLLGAPVLAVIAGAPLIALHAFRRDVGTDYASYVEIYERFIDGASVWWYEPLYSIVNILATPAGSAGVVVVFAIAAVLSSVPVLVRVFQLSPAPWLSVVALFAIGYPFMQTNAVRSVIAVSIVFFVLPMVWRKKPWHWLAGGVLAAGFHYTALFVLPFYWLLRWNMHVVWAAGLLGAAVVLSTQKQVALLFLEIAPALLPSAYANYPGQVAARLGDFGLSPGSAWYMASALMVLFVWQRVARLGEAETVVRNAFFFGLLVLVATSQFWVVGRIGWFFYIAGVLFWPIVVCRLVNAGRGLVALGVAAVHLVLLAYFYVIGAHDAVPYQSIWN